MPRVIIIILVLFVNILRISSNGQVKKNLINKCYKLICFYISLFLQYNLSEQNLIKLATDLSNLDHLNKVLDNLLVERVVGTTGHENVKNYIIDHMRQLEWDVEVDEFQATTPIFGMLKFTNIIATLNSKASRFLVLACHYDSKYMKNEKFIGATDSGVPCAMMINIAHTLQSSLKKSKSKNDISLKLIFFDGEEAFEHWGPNDSIYGAKHLASKMEKDNTIKQIDMLVLLDLIGAPDPSFYSYFQATEKSYVDLLQVEDLLSNRGHLVRHSHSSISPNTGSSRYFQPHSYNAFIEDDHVPFLQRNVPILHLIPAPFPDFWHKIEDNRDAIDLNTVENINKILRVFITNYLKLSV